MANVTIKKANSKEIKGGYTKYGFQIQHPKFDGEWINVVDWDDVHGGKEFSAGDEVEITKPEKGEYGWEANFEQQAQGFSDEEADNFTLNRILKGIAKNREYLVQILQDRGVEVTTQQGDIEYPEPTKEQLNQTFDDDSNEVQGESIDDINW